MDPPFGMDPSFPGRFPPGGPFPGGPPFPHGPPGNMPMMLDRHGPPGNMPMLPDRHGPPGNMPMLPDRPPMPFPPMADSAMFGPPMHGPMHHGMPDPANMNWQQDNGPIYFGRVYDSSKLKERGYGFICPDRGSDSSENIFFHIHWLAAHLLPHPLVGGKPGRREVCGVLCGMRVACV